MIRVRPPGPWLPTWQETPGEVDLGVRLRDTEFTGPNLRGPVREGIKARLAEAVEHGRYAEAAVLLRALVDTWPLSALVDEARQAWVRSADGTALAVLARSASVICLGRGWTTVPEGIWPLPDSEWVRRAVGSARPLGVWGRGGGDGAGLIAAALACELLDLELPAEAPVVEVRGIEVVALRAEIGRRLARGEAAAVRVLAPVPDDPDTALALGEFRMEADAQAAFEQYGRAGLVAVHAPAWAEVLSGPTPGVPGAVLRAACDTALLPGTPGRIEQGNVETVGWLLWYGPRQPVPVHPVAIGVLRAVDGVRDTEEVAAATGAPREHVQGVLDELVSIGAATAVDTAASSVLPHQ